MIEPDDTRARILHAAAAVFAAQGYDGASTRALAAAAACNVATLAYHFGGKEGLYHAVLDAQYAQLLAFTLPTPLPDAPDDRIRALVAALFRFARLHRDAVRILLRHVLDHGQLPDPVRARWTTESFVRVAELAAALDLPLLQHPLALLTLNHLIARYAVMADDALRGLVEGAADDTIAAHLGEVAVRLLR